MRISDWSSGVCSSDLKGEASASLPKSLHHELSRANNWSNAMDRVELIEKSADKNGMDAITATSDAYPKNLLDAGRTDALYPMGAVAIGRASCRERGGQYV